MDFLAWLESTALAEWGRVSILGYPLLITLHSIGLAVMAGLSFVIDLRLLGRFRSMPLSSFRIMFKVAWIGFLVNFVSGCGLFSMQATSYVSNVPFLLKMAFVLTGAASIAYLQAASGRKLAHLPDVVAGSAPAEAVVAASGNLRHAELAVAALGGGNPGHAQLSVGGAPGGNPGHGEPTAGAGHLAYGEPVLHNAARVVALLSIILWLGAIVTGRFIAYL